MFFVIHALDRPNCIQRRLAHYGAHKSYLAGAAMKTLISGPLLADDGETMIGSCFLVEADTKGDVEAFNAADPFNIANIWDRVEIHPFSKRVDNR